MSEIKYADQLKVGDVILAEENPRNGYMVPLEFGPTTVRLITEGFRLRVPIINLYLTGYVHRAVTPDRRYEIATNREETEGSSWVE